MDLGYAALIAITATLLLALIQRTEKTKRRIVSAFVLICFLVMRHNAFIKDDLHTETLLGFALGVLFSGLFWLLIGQYNPVGTSDEIHVIGMDD